MSSKTDASALVVFRLVAIAVIVRVIGLNGGLWVDEVYSLVRSFREPMGTILTEYWGDNHHPFYAVLAHISRAVFGESAWSIRLPAMLFGVAAVPMLWRLGERVASRREAIMAALLLAVSYHHVWFSQNARGYSAIAFFAIATLWALLRGVESGERRYFFVYAVLAALGAYTHLTMIFVVVGHAAAMGVWLLMTRVPNRGRLVGFGVLAFGLSAVGTLLLYAPMLRAVLAFFTQQKSGLAGVSTPSWAAVEMVRGLMLGLGAGGTVVAAIVLSIGAAVGVAGVASLWRTQRLFLLATLAPIGVTILGAAATRGTMYPRFFFFAIGPAILIAVHGAFVSCKWLATRFSSVRSGERLATIALSLGVILSALSLRADYRFPKQDFEGAMNFVLAERGAGDMVVTAGIPSNPLNTLYRQPWPVVSSRASLDSVRSSAARTWVIWSFPRILERSAPEIAQLLSQDCPHPRTFRGTVGGGDILVCVLNRP